MTGVVFSAQDRVGNTASTSPARRQGAAHRVLGRRPCNWTLWRSLLALFAFSLSALAQTGPPTPAETAQAKAECVKEVAVACLHTLALDRLLQSPLQDLSERSRVDILNRLAVSQIQSGDKAGALRTLGLTDPAFETLVQLGRWDEAWAKAQAILAKGDRTFGDTDEGGFKRYLVNGMLDLGETRLALSTALSIPDKNLDDRGKALLDIVRHSTAAGEIATALAAANGIEEGETPYEDDRSQALQVIVEAHVKAGTLADAEALLDRVGPTFSSLRPRLILAKAWHEAGFEEKAERQFDLVLDRMTQSPDWGRALLGILLDSAGMAMELDMTPVARRHALAAFDQFDSPTLDNYPYLDKVEQLRLAIILEHVGVVGKAKALRLMESRHAFPPDNWQLIVLIEQISGQLQDDGTSSEAVLKDLRWLTVAFPPVSDEDRVGRTFQILHDAGLDTEARKFATDVAGLNAKGIDVFSLLEVLLVQDLSLAPALTAAAPDPWIRLDLSLVQARELAKAGRAVEARGLLRDLLAKMTPCGRDSLETHRAEGGTRPSVIAAQAQLGFAEDARLARRECLAGNMAEARDPMDDFWRYEDLARTFPVLGNP